MNIKKIVAITVVLLLIISSFAGCRKVNGDNQSVLSNSSNTNIAYGNVDIIDNNSSDVGSLIEDASQIEDTTVSDTQTGDTSSSASSTDTIIEEPNKNINPDGIEIYGSGTADDPYIDTPNADTHTVKTLSIPAGQSVFYNIYRVGGRIFTLNSSSAYVICNGTKYDAQNGKVSFKVVDALASDAVAFEIGNTGSSAANFTITFTDLEGSMANPTVINTFSSNIKVDIAEGNEIGHFYKYIAEKDGVLKFYLLSGTEKGILLATNNRNSAQRSTESSEEGEVKTDDTGTYIELEVKKGDELVINVGSKPNKRGKYPATAIEWIAKF